MFAEQMPDLKQLGQPRRRFWEFDEDSQTVSAYGIVLGYFSRPVDKLRAGSRLNR